MELETIPNMKIYHFPLRLGDHSKMPKFDPFRLWDNYKRWAKNNNVIFEPSTPKIAHLDPELFHPTKQVDKAVPTSIM